VKPNLQSVAYAEALRDVEWDAIKVGSMQKGVGNVLEISSPVAMWILISFRRLFKIQAFFVGQLKIRGDFWTRDHKLLMSLP